MFCGQLVCRDRDCEICRASRRSLIAILTLASSLFAFAVIAFVLLLSGGCASDDDDDDACVPTPQLDTTGNIIDCDCDCEGRWACPLIAEGGRSRVPACWEDDDANGG
jgi:hypothetical protein